MVFRTRGSVVGESGPTWKQPAIVFALAWPAEVDEFTARKRDSHVDRQRLLCLTRVPQEPPQPFERNTSWKLCTHLGSVAQGCAARGSRSRLLVA